MRFPLLKAIVCGFLLTVGFGPAYACSITKDEMLSMMQRQGVQVEVLNKADTATVVDAAAPPGDFDELDLLTLAEKGAAMIVVIKDGCADTHTPLIDLNVINQLLHRSQANG